MEAKLLHGYIQFLKIATIAPTFNQIGDISSKRYFIIDQNITEYFCILFVKYPLVHPDNVYKFHYVLNSVTLLKHKTKYIIYRNVTEYI